MAVISLQYLAISPRREEDWESFRVLLGIGSSARIDSSDSEIVEFLDSIEFDLNFFKRDRGLRRGADILLDSGGLTLDSGIQAE